uniref:Putative ovule protein n=1 Tax=Solanum chacoense TaxID=4108 RepID=A0A0V0GRI6_SOLCH
MFILLGRVRWMRIYTSKEEVTTLFFGGGVRYAVRCMKKERILVQCIGGWTFHSQVNVFRICLLLVIY